MLACNIKTRQVNIIIPILNYRLKEIILRSHVTLISVDAMKHTYLHSNGFSPVCTRRCFFSASGDKNVFGHKSHWTGRSPVCMRSCTNNCWFVKNSFGQYLHFFFCLWGVPA